MPVVEHKTDTTYITKNHRDSIYVHDSTYIHERGDTVWVERWHTRWRDIYQIDTIYEAVHDTIPYPVEVPKEVPASLTWWQQTRIYMGNIAIFASIIILIILYVKSRLKL